MGEAEMITDLFRKSFEKFAVKHPEAFLFQKMSRSSYPERVCLSVADVCNLQCQICGTYGNNKKGMLENKGLMKFEDWKYIIDSLPQGTRVSPASNGEPLLNKSLIPMLKYAIDQGFEIEGFNTNGMLLTQELQEQLIGLNYPLYIQVSIDGMKESSEKQRVGSDWNLIVAQVDNLLMLNRKWKGKLSISVDATRTSQSTEEMNEFVQFWGRKGIHSFAIQSSTQETDAGCVWNRESIMNPDLFPRTIPPNYVCGFLYHWLMISHDLERYSICCRDWFFSNKNDFSDSNIKKCWNSQEYKKILRDQFFNTKGKVCHNCEYKYVGLSQKRQSFAKYGENRYRIIDTFYNRTYYLI